MPAQATPRERVGAWSRGCLAMQGYGALSDQERRAQWLGLRFSPILCTALMAIGVALPEPILLFSVAAVAFVGGFRSKHPFDYLYEMVVRPLLAAPPVPPQPAPRRFACKLAGGWLVATGLAFVFAPDAVGYALGGVLVAVAVVVSTTNWCLPSLIYAVGTRLLARAGAEGAGAARL